MNLPTSILKLFGWKVEITVPDFPKCIICVAPHTSNWDFVIGRLAYASAGRKAGFLMKSSWFFWPMGPILKKIGGVPVVRKKTKGWLTTEMINKFNSSEKLTIAITPEGTRSRTANWHTGFLHIAYGAKIPVVLGVIDYSLKKVIINTVFQPTGDATTDLIAVKKYFAPFKGRHPEKFTTDEE